MLDYNGYLNEIYQKLSLLEVKDKQGENLPPDLGYKKWVEFTYQIARQGKNIYLIGNGASSMMASHMAADATKNGKLKALAFNDPALLTAIGNDLEYQQSFALPLERFAQPGDLLITISSSGNSANIIAAIDIAKQKEMLVVTVSGLKPDNKSRLLGDLNFYVPLLTYGQVESAHQLILHYWLDLYLENYHR